MDEREQNLNREEKADGMPDVMMEIPADEFSADEFSADEAPADETPADGVSADEIPAEDISADEIPVDVSVDVFPDEQKEEPLTVSSESVTEILMPENKELSSERQTEPFGSDEPHMYGGDQNWSEDAVRTASPDLSGAQENDGAADLVGTSPSDSFEQNTTYVRTEEPSEVSKTLEHSPQTEEEPYRQAGMSEEQLNHQADRSVEEQYRQAGRPEGEQYRQTGGSGEEQYRQTGRNEQEPYRQDGGRNADWRSRASRTNDTNGSFDSAEGRNGGRYSSSYDRYRFENPSNRGPVNTPDSRFPEESKKPSSGKEHKNGKRGWIAAGIAAGVLAAAFLLFFGIRAALMSAVNTARSTPPAEAQAGAQAGAEAEAPAKEPEITIGNPDQKPENPQAAGRADTETTEQPSISKTTSYDQQNDELPSAIQRVAVNDKEAAIEEEVPTEENVPAYTSADDPNLHYASNETKTDTVPYQEPARVDEFITKFANYYKVKEGELKCSATQDSNVVSAVYVFPDTKEIDVFSRLLQAACWYSDETPGYLLSFSHQQFFFELKDMRKQLHYRWIAERVNGRILLYTTNAPIGEKTSSVCYQDYRDQLMRTRIYTKTKEL